MLKSMTGYGYTQLENDSCSIIVELKSLNSKFLDLSVKLSKEIGEKELEIRNQVKDLLIRGKVMLKVEYASKQKDDNHELINQDLLHTYYHQLKSSAEALQDESKELFSLALQMPDVISSRKTEKNIEEDWQLITEGIREAAHQCDLFRIQEGKAIKNDVLECIHHIKTLLQDIDGSEAERALFLRKKIQDRIAEIKKDELFDPNRFEQEMLYYLEKIDINEEKKRLNNHIEYFLEVVQAGHTNGKKLGFITQEMGREINTLGAKANDATIQKKVVEMKEALEKIKEQNLNIL